MCGYMDQRDFSFLYVVSQEMIPHFYVLCFGVKHLVLCYTYGTGVVILKWDMGILSSPQSLMVYVIQRSREQQLATDTYSASVVD
jgi:succinate dehydrogenase/fumarate reductase cytochrome b subunit